MRWQKRGNDTANNRLQAKQAIEYIMSERIIILLRQLFEAVAFQIPVLHKAASR